MSKNFLRKSIALLVAFVLLAGLITACGGNNQTQSDNSSVAAATPAASTQTETPKSVEKTTVNLWYLWADETGKRVEEFISNFNKSQDKYEVKGLFIADMQKVKVAIAGGTGPDLTDDFDGNISSYADQGIVEPLDEYIKRDNINFDDYISGAIDTCKYNDKIYALPCGVTQFMLYYNKTLLAKAGYNEPPKTDKELLEMAIKTTEVNSDKSIKVLGFPDFPFVYYHRNMLTALGGSIFDHNTGKLVPESPESIAAINLMIDYRTKFGVDNVLKFNQAGKYTDATDPFMTGNQVFRIDGFWLADTIRTTLKIDQSKLDFGIAPLPYPDGKPELANRGEISASVFYIPSNAKNKEGAWEVMKRIHSGEWEKYIKGFPVQKSLLTDPMYTSMPGFTEFAEFSKVGTFIAPVASAKNTEALKAYSDELELAVTMKETPEVAMKAAAEKANKILGK